MNDMSPKFPKDNSSATEEAARLTTGQDYWTTVDGPENGVRSLRFADGPHGLRLQDDENPDHLGLERSLPATCFPPAVTLASSWDQELIQTVGEALGKEARAVNIDVVLGPGMNIKRSPLCGRNFEYFSEDPYLSGVLAAASVTGIQSQGVAACLKHFAVNNQETDRLRITADVDERALREIYLRGFETAISRSNPWSIMSSYNRINGVHASENSWLLKDVLREEWSYDGLVVSDWGAVRDPVASLVNGLDLRMPGRQADTGKIKAAHSGGTVSDDDLSASVGRLRLLAERTTSLTPMVSVDFDAHHNLVRRAAAESAVLLTNDGTLPLSFTSGQHVAIIGELARKPRYQGAGSSYVNPTKVTTGLDVLTDVIESAGASVSFSSGYSLKKGSDTHNLLTEAVEAAKNSDVVILFLGLPGDYEAEGRDRTTIELPDDQLTLLASLESIEAKKVVALCNGSAVSTRFWKHSVNAIVEFWLTGQANGEVVADILTGAVNPSGKLAETVPCRLEDTPSYLSFPGEHGVVTYSEGIFVGYRYYDARKLDVDYAFGHGISYTSFAYSNLNVTVRGLDDATAFVVSAEITNVGQVEGAEVVQLYVGDRGGFVITPPHELRGWAKVKLAPRERKTIQISVPREQLKHWNSTTRTWEYTGGPLDLLLGSSSRDIRLVERIDVPGVPVVVKLSVWSTLGEWLDHPTAGPVLSKLFEDRGGVGGRIGDLLSDEGGQDSVRGIPMGTVAGFPGVPVSEDDLETILEILPTQDP